MRKYLHITLLLIVGAVGLIQGQPTDANIFGDVTCGNDHIPFISVYLKGTTIGTTTDNTGHFQLINLHPGEYTLVAQGVGYKTKEVKITVEKNKTSEIRFILEEDVLNLEGVVITGNRHEITRNEAPVIVSTISSRLFESTQAISIAGGLDFVPGLRLVRNCQNCGFSQVRMNGLDGPYSQILINSHPVFSGLAGVYGLELIPAAMVKQIEVVRGGGSVMFGGNAIAGTVNIITKEPAFNSFNIEGRYGIIGVGNKYGTSPASDKLLNLNGSIVSNDLKAGIFLFGMARERDPFDENGDDFSEMVSMSNTTFGFNSYYKTSKYGKINLDFYRINEFRRGGNKFDYLPHEADIAEQLDHNITGFNLSYDLYTNPEKMNKLNFYAAGQTVRRDSYYGAEQDPNAYGYTRDLTTSVGGQYHLNISNSSGLLLGIDDNFTRLKDTKLGVSGNPLSVIIDQFVNTLGVFSQYEFKSRAVKASLGLRYDAYMIRDLDEEHDEDESIDNNGNVLAPRINLLFDIAPLLQFRMAYSKGYRAPQIFNEDLHIEASGARSVVHRNNPDLKQESSHSFTTSLRYTRIFGRLISEFLAEGFYTRLLDPFAYDYTLVDSTKTLYQVRTNAESGAFVAGINFELNMAFPQKVILQLGYTLQTSKYDKSQFWGEEESSVTNHFIKAPGQYGYLTADLNPSKRWDISFASNYTGSMYVPHFGLPPITEEEQDFINNGEITNIEESRQKEIKAILNEDVIEGERLEKTDKFLVFGFRVAYTLPLSDEASLQFYGGVQNIFNQTQKYYDSGVYRDAGYVYGPCQPRTINLGLKFGNMF